ncbi:type II toxin-antitoxin system RelE/ParE family toxin [bacterium]|nr:type II toxin-antitoxin system RelE/ParE family toxin [bacterium]
MKYGVYVVSDSEEDLLDIYRHISQSDSVEKAEQVFVKIEEKCLALSTFPERGHLPPELERIGISEFREIHFKPYRIIYQIIRKDVYILCILDGRRELQELLERRIIR